MSNLTKAQKSQEQIEIAQEIQRQIGRNTLMFVGANAFCAMPRNLENGVRGGLQFKASGKHCKRGGRIIIELTTMDEYKVTLGRITKHQWKELGQADGVYCDNLRDVIEDLIG